MAWTTHLKVSSVCLAAKRFSAGKARDMILWSTAAISLASRCLSMSANFLTVFFLSIAKNNLSIMR